MDQPDASCSPRSGTSRRIETDLVCVLPEGGRIVLYEPVGPARCDRCRDRADDVCFRIANVGGTVADGGLCAFCLADVLRVAAGR